MNYLSSKQKGKKEIVHAKALLVRLKLIIGAGMATMTPPLGPVLGQYGINIMEFCNEFNTETKEFEKGLALRVILYINVNKAFYFEIQKPKLSIVLKEFYKKEFQTTSTSKIYIKKNKLLKDCFKIVLMFLSFNSSKKIKWQEINPRLLQIKLLEVLGTCRSCKIYIQ